MNKKIFIFESVIKDPVNLCNLKKEITAIQDYIKTGKNVLLFGRRNTGKTSLIESIIIPEWIKSNKRGLYLMVDLYGVRSLTHISARIADSLSQSLIRIFKIKTFFQLILKIISSLRPKITFDDEARPQIELTYQDNKIPNFIEIFSKLNTFYKKNIPVLLIIDEFQDIANIEQAQGLIRNALQNLNPAIPVIILGSKKHMLREIFSEPGAPLYNWGESVEIPPIDYNEYTKYIKERGLNIALEESIYLQDKMKRIPESINILCYYLQKNQKYDKKIKTSDIDDALNEIINNRKGRPQEFLLSLTEKQAKFLKALSNHSIIRKITSKKLQQETQLTSAGILKIVRFFENHGVIYKTQEGYQIDDIFLELHLRRFGI